MTSLPGDDFLSPAPDLDGASLLITGGTGSFGKQFVGAVLERFRPRRLVIYSRDEMKQYQMQEDPAFNGHPALRYFIGDVRDSSRLDMAMREIDYVIHTAALKQVPTAEYNPFECINTNVIGAENVVQAAIRSGVRKVIALSTDKAANPVNLYGASKLAAEKIFIAANNLSSQTGPRFGVVRYGNVVGSRGSVIPLFCKLVSENANSLPITDPRMTRFWITLQQGVNFVLSCLTLLQGGETFVPRIPSMKITDLAHAIAPHMAHRVIGIRPGEKLHEVLITADDCRFTFELDDRYVIAPAFRFWTDEPYRIEGARPVADGFSYTSDINDRWLDGKALRHWCDLPPA